MYIYLVPVVGIGYYLYKHHFGVPKYHEQDNLSGKVAVITGGSSGIGLELAHRLAKQNAILVLGCRNIKECHEKRVEIIEKSQNQNIFCSKLNLESSQSIIKFVERLSNRFDKVDILVNSAGYKGSKKLALTNEYIEKQLAVNAVGPYLLTKSLIPLLTASKSARVLYLICEKFTSGKIKTDDINSLDKYNVYQSFFQSQLMRFLLMKYFSKQYFTSTKITFNACDPGPTNTAFHDRAIYNETFLRYPIQYLNFLIMRNPSVAVETPVMCCSSKEMFGISGKVYCDMEEVEVSPDLLKPELMESAISILEQFTDFKSQLVVDNK